MKEIDEHFNGIKKCVDDLLASNPSEEEKLLALEAIQRLQAKIEDLIKAKENPH